VGETVCFDERGVEFVVPGEGFGLGVVGECQSGLPLEENMLQFDGFETNREIVQRLERYLDKFHPERKKTSSRIALQKDEGVIKRDVEMRL